MTFANNFGDALRNAMKSTAARLPRNSPHKSIELRVRITILADKGPAVDPEAFSREHVRPASKAKTMLLIRLNQLMEKMKPLIVAY